MSTFISTTLTGTGVSEWLRADSSSSSGADFLLVLEIEGTLSGVTVEFTIDQDLTNPSAISHDILKNLNCSCASILDFPATAFRIKTTGAGNGVASLKVLQTKIS